jgi:hypothetical protein
MKKILFLLLITQFTFAQTQNKKVKIVLLGTFHFGATTDRNSTKFEDIFSEKRQAELDSLAKKLAKNGIDKIFIEDIVPNQKKQEKLYQKYLKNEITDQKILKNEIVQVAFRTARLSNAKLICADLEQELPYDKIEAWGKKHKDEKYPYSFF